MEIRIDNVNEVLAAIGLTGQHERKGQGWHRVYIHAPQEGIDVTLYLGRVMFQHGVFQWVKWCVPPNEGELQDYDVYWFRWAVYTATGKHLGPKSWARLKAKAQERAQAKRDAAKAARDALNADRVAAGKKPLTRALAPVNPRRAACMIVGEWLSAELGREVHLFAF